MDKHKVTLFEEERQQLKHMVKRGKAAARKLTHARILLLADESEGRNGHTDDQIAETLQVNLRTISRVRKRFVMEGFQAAVDPRPQPPRPEKVKLNEPLERQLIELACGDPPLGRCGWTLQLLADRLAVLSQVESVSRETVRQALKKRHLPGDGEDVVHSSHGQRGVCLADGRCAASLRPPVQSGFPGGLPG